MGRRSTPFSFPNGRGQRLAGILDLPAAAPLCLGVFAPCFTCVKESHAAAKVCREMAQNGVAMLRFDMTGLGGSEGDFGETNFTTRIADIAAACRALESAHGAPALLVGHSISGTAALHAAAELPFVRAVATIGSPRDPARVIGKFRAGNLVKDAGGGYIEVDVLGTPVRFRASFEDDMLSHDTAAAARALGRKLFVFHAPRDRIVAFDNARAIADMAGGDAQVIALDEGATHLFENRADDAIEVVGVLLDWCARHLRPAA